VPPCPFPFEKRKLVQKRWAFFPGLCRHQPPPLAAGTGAARQRRAWKARMPFLQGRRRQTWKMARVEIARVGHHWATCHRLQSAGTVWEEETMWEAQHWETLQL
jgi:hypothetical protein